MNAVPNSVLNGFLAAFGAAPPPPVFTARLEAIHRDLETELCAQLADRGLCTRLGREAPELHATPSDPASAGAVMADLLRQRDWPLLRLEARPWGYALLARAGSRAVALGGLVLEAGTFWLAHYEVALN